MISEKCVIFLAEDNPADVNLLRIALARQELRCELAVHADGMAALVAIERAEAGLGARPDLFLIDFHLARLDGLALLHRIRQSPVFGSAPVILWSSLESPVDRKRAEDGGANGHWIKPETLAPFLALGGRLKEFVGHRTELPEEARPSVE